MNTQAFAKLAGVSLRTLRHYDAIGLLRPCARAENGYRVYGPKDAERFQQILFYRELGFPLDRIREMLDDPGYDRVSALKEQAEELSRLSERYARLSALARETLDNLTGGIPMDEKKLLEGFSYEAAMAHQKKHERETKERWGDTDAYKQSAKRAASYVKEDWERIGARQAANLSELVACFSERVPCESERMQAVCREARQIITDSFYDCTLEIFSGLGAMYVADPRFTEFYDKHAPGLAAYFNEAIQHYCVGAAGE